ncbi:hypothetical protein BGZ98_005059, partial [Dissophora globulifera]
MALEASIAFVEAAVDATAKGIPGIPAEASAAAAVASFDKDVAAAADDSDDIAG